MGENHEGSGLKRGGGTQRHRAGGDTGRERIKRQVNFEGEDVGEDYFCPLSLTVRRGGAPEQHLIPPAPLCDWGWAGHGAPRAL